MKKILITSLFAIILITNQLNAEEIKQTKQVKETKKKELSKEDEEFLKKMEKLDNTEKTADKILKKIQNEKK